MESTIKEALNKLNIGKTTLYDRMDKLRIRPMKRGNRAYLTEEQLVLLNTNPENLGRTSEENRTDSAGYRRTNHDSILEKQLEFMQSQLEEKDQQLRKMQSLLDQEQQLSMTKERRILELEDLRNHRNNSDGILPTKEWLTEFVAQIKQNQESFDAMKS